MVANTLTEALKKEIGQHFVFGFHGKEPSEDVRVLIRDYHVGNIILMKRNVQDASQTRELIRNLQVIAKEAGHSRPLLIGTDQENGLVSPTAGTQFPGAMTLAATGSTSIAEEIASASGKELAAVGIHWTYSPVADVNSNPRNPVIGVRSFGDDPQKISEFALAVSRGMVSSSVASCAKHFPGHGDTHVDSHLALPIISKTSSDLHTTELVPFKALISSGIPSIMTAHVALPEITGDTTPSSLSRAITTDLLRTELGYEGVVVTDCLEMDAVMKVYGSERAAVESLKAGADIAMICHTFEKHVGAVKLAWEAVEAGGISLNEFKKSSARIEAFKDRFAGRWDDVLSQSSGDDFKVAWSQLHEANKHVSQLGYESSVTVITNPSNAIPLSGTDNILLFTPEMESLNRAVDDPENVIRTSKGLVRNTAGASYLALSSSVAARAQSEHIVYVKSTAQSSELGIDLDGTFNTIIFVLRNANRSTWQIDYLRNVLKQLAQTKRGGKVVPKIILLSSCEPYDLLGVTDIDLGVVAHVASFEFTAVALETAAAVIFGEVPAKGQIPVLNGHVAGKSV